MIINRAFCGFYSYISCKSIWNLEKEVIRTQSPSALSATQKMRHGAAAAVTNIPRAFIMAAVVNFVVSALLPINMEELSKPIPSLTSPPTLQDRAVDLFFGVMLEEIMTRVILQQTMLQLASTGVRAFSILKSRKVRMTISALLFAGSHFRALIADPRVPFQMPLNQCIRLLLCADYVSLYEVAGLPATVTAMKSPGCQPP